MPAASVFAEVERGVVATPVEDDERDPDLVADDRDRQDQPPRSARQPRPAQRRLHGRLQEASKRRGRLRGEIAAPTVDPAECARRQREQGEVAAAVCRDEAGVAQHRRCARKPGRSGLLDGDELLEALLQDEWRRNGVARLLRLAALERGAVRDREERDADAEDEEDDGEQNASGRARERQQRDAQ